MMILRRQLRENFAEHRLVVGDQLAFGPPLACAAERIESGAAQDLEPRQNAEQRQQPRTETHLARLAGRRIEPRQKWRREMKFKTQIVAIKRVSDLAFESAIGVKPCHFVFVL